MKRLLAILLLALAGCSTFTGGGYVADSWADNKSENYYVMTPEELSNTVVAWRNHIATWEYSYHMDCSYHTQACYTFFRMKYAKNPQLGAQSVAVFPHEVLMVKTTDGQKLIETISGRVYELRR